MEATEAHEIAEKIHEDAERGEHDTFRRLSAIYVGVVAMLLAIATLGGGDATKEMLAANIHASDQYAFYQSKYERQLSYQIAAEQLELIAAGIPNLSAEQSAKVQKLVRHYRDTAERYESDPARKNGKKELLEKAEHWAARRDHAAEQSPNFEYAAALFQIAIVLGSVAIVASSPLLLGISSILAVCGIALAANGFLLAVHLPVG